MRTELAAYHGREHQFSATFGAYRDYYVPANLGKHKRKLKHTVLLLDIANPEGYTLSDHVWVQSTSELIQLKGQRGDKLTFSAYVGTYKRPNGDIEYGLQHLRKVRRNS